MRTTSSLTVLILLNLFSTTSFAQEFPAVPFLLLNPSPSLSAMGATGTALQTEDPLGFLWNPAQLGYTSQTNNLSFIFYPLKIEWVPVYYSNIESQAIALNVGHNFKDLIGFPVSFGFGYSNTKFDYEIPYCLSCSQPRDDYNAYSFGLGIDYLVQFRIGYSIKM